MTTKEFLISTNAAKQIMLLLKKTKQPNNARMRITVEGGGCSGFQYNFDFDTSVNDDDIVFNKDEIEVIIDELSLTFLDKAELDYINELGASAFKIHNPNVAASCGCGNSFSIDMD